MIPLVYGVFYEEEKKRNPSVDNCKILKVDVAQKSVGKQVIYTKELVRLIIYEKCGPEATPAKTSHRWRHRYLSEAKLCRNMAATTIGKRNSQPRRDVTFLTIPR